MTAATDAPDWSDLLVEPKLVEQLQRLSAWWRRTGGAGDGRSGGTVLFLHGPAGAGQEQASEAFCASVALRLLRVTTSAALRADVEWERIVELTYREAILLNAAVYWSDCGPLASPDRPSAEWDILVRSAERFSCLTFFESEVDWDPSGTFRDRPFRRLEFAMPGYPLRQRIWAHYLQGQLFDPPGTDVDALARELANAFQLAQGQIEDALSTAQGLAALRDPSTLTRDDLFEGCRRQSSRHLIAFAQRIVPRTDLTLGDVALPKANERQLREVWQRIRLNQRVLVEHGFDRRLMLGKGLIVLFSGGPGTGKTMAAEVLAAKSQRSLYRVDLSAVASKWVGDMEKNLNRLFTEAADANAILFFDEADTVFGRRGEVKEAQDRWANMEVNYLLQRIEEYDGIVILASNLRQNIDDAFIRRIHMIVEFPSPDVERRLQIVRSLFPPQVTRPDDRELRAFVESFKLPGGNFRNIVMDAAVRAKQDSLDMGQPYAISLRHLILATAREYQKMGRPITKGDFQEPFYGWILQDILV